MNAKNVLGTDLQTCSTSPITGFYRDGCCHTGAGDMGVHVVCAEVSAEFLEFSRQCGNDLSTANPLNQFPGLQSGDRWCICARHWREAMEAGAAPLVLLTSTHISALEFIDLADLRAHAKHAADDTPSGNEKTD